MRDPAEYGWWLASRASGVVALILVTISVAIGLTMASKIVRKRGAGPILARVHEHTALMGLIAIAVHGITLLGDKWLNPGVKGVLVPFAMDHKPAFTGLGIIAGYLAAALGLTYYARRRIGAKLWRKAHRATVLVWALGVVHTIGAGTDASEPWLREFMVLTGVPIVVLFGVRMFHRPAKPAAARAAEARPDAARREGRSAAGGHAAPQTQEATA
jgi:sulfoxide reductase heme-binding subunit YedZ